MKLRPYQEKVLDRVLSTDDDLVVVSPTGSGKTTIAAAIVQAFPSALCLAPRTEIADQLRERTGATSVTVQSLLRGNKEGFEPELLIVDECHHMVDGNRWSDVMKLFPQARLVGLTATPVPELSRDFQSLVVAADYSELVQEGFLVDCDVYAPPYRMLGSVALDPVIAYNQHGHGQAFVFAPNIKLSKQWAADFSRQGLKAAHLDGTTKKDERQDIIARFRSGEIRILCNYDIATEGFDHPGAETVILGRKFGTQTAFIQATGRVLRPCPGKSRATCIDLTGATHRHGFPTDDRDYILGQHATRKDGDVPPIRPCLQCGFTQLSRFPFCKRCNFQFPKEDPREVKIRNLELQKITLAESTREERMEFLKKKVNVAIFLGKPLYGVGREFKEKFGIAAPMGDLPNASQLMQREIGLLSKSRPRNAAYYIAKGMFE